eukprot:CAMPEP_0114514630 /NCGR_PEP_ID=MMETSP0109-20121206/16262_1 /TAXON_ID=29199 /ORGANISM="Chlorarachnion reptans, Strain CCCM449" /LENGTH=466 /DNA_ID=CAMNT_0001694695 /DNA_START=207 /DNA_END=1604 /DNA_ORIENTATION=-
MCDAAENRAREKAAEETARVNALNLERCRQEAERQARKRDQERKLKEEMERLRNEQDKKKNILTNLKESWRTSSGISDMKRAIEELEEKSIYETFKKMGADKVVENLKQNVESYAGAGHVIIKTVDNIRNEIKQCFSDEEKKLVKPCIDRYKDLGNQLVGVQEEFNKDLKECVQALGVRRVLMERNTNPALNNPIMLSKYLQEIEELCERTRLRVSGMKLALEMVVKDQERLGEFLKGREDAFEDLRRKISSLKGITLKDLEYTATFDVNTNKTTTETTTKTKTIIKEGSKVLQVVEGVVIGAGAGATVGDCIFGGPGAIVGGIIGGIVGGIIGFFFSKPKRTTEKQVEIKQVEIKSKSIVVTKNNDCSESVNLEEWVKTIHKLLDSLNDDQKDMFELRRDFLMESTPICEEWKEEIKRTDSISSSLDSFENKIRHLKTLLSRDNASAVEIEAVKLELEAVEKELW